MKPPVETVRISKQGRDILSKIKRRTSLERWNDISRAALCRSLNNRSAPPVSKKGWDSAIEIEWKTFAGEIGDELSAMILTRASADGVDLADSAGVSSYFRAHIERGISSLQNVKDLSMYMDFISNPEI
jgi:DNA sulfur modification protein DndE